ncbi:MAG: acetyl esterase [Acidimicrobiaceae bacterium]|jgi:acetyl esterase/lipase|nr:acetyl esterase [Acidimicrobiaceae bacterium]
MPYRFDPELAAVIPAIPTVDFADVDAARAGLDELSAQASQQVDTSGVIIEDRLVPASGGHRIPVRVYAPDERNGQLPGVVYIHGGGFAVGSVESEHAGAVLLAKTAGAVVVSVDYRLAPEYPFPAGLDDCYDALSWVRDSADELDVDADRIAVFGNSAGGGLAAGLALMARDRGGPSLCFQYLGIPELDDRLETVSMQTFVDTPLWNRPNAVISWQFYLGDDRGEVSPYAAPARAVDLSGLPPTYISTMEFDPLRDEGLIYGLRLLQAGVTVEIHQYPGTFHGSALVFTAATSVRQSAESMDVMRRALHGS